MSVFHKTMVWLGLVDDEYYGEDDEYYADEYGEPISAPARQQDQQVDVEGRAEDLLHGRGVRYRPRACRRSFSSSETSTFDGVSRNT